MGKKDLFFIGILVAVVGLFIFLSVTSRKPAPMSARAEHAGMSKETPRDTCLQCHASGNEIVPMPQGTRHPKKGGPLDNKGTPCSLCHQPPDTASATLHLQKEGLRTWLNQQEK